MTVGDPSGTRPWGLTWFPVVSTPTCLRTLVFFLVHSLWTQGVTFKVSNGTHRTLYGEVKRSSILNTEGSTDTSYLRVDQSTN